MKWKEWRIVALRYDVISILFSWNVKSEELWLWYMLWESGGRISQWKLTNLCVMKGFQEGIGFWGKYWGKGWIEEVIFLPNKRFCNFSYVLHCDVLNWQRRKKGWSCQWQIHALSTSNQHDNAAATSSYAMMIGLGERCYFLFEPNKVVEISWLLSFQGN